MGKGLQGWKDRLPTPDRHGSDVRSDEAAGPGHFGGEDPLPEREPAGPSPEAGLLSRAKCVPNHPCLGRKNGEETQSRRPFSVFSFSPPLSHKVVLRVEWAAPFFSRGSSGRGPCQEASSHPTVFPRLFLSLFEVLGSNALFSSLFFVHSFTGGLRSSLSTLFVRALILRHTHACIYQGCNFLGKGQPGVGWPGPLRINTGSWGKVGVWGRSPLRKIYDLIFLCHLSRERADGTPGRIELNWFRGGPGPYWLAKCPRILYRHVMDNCWQAFFNNNKWRADLRTSGTASGSSTRSGRKPGC